MLNAEYPRRPAHLYDTIGQEYARYRRPDPRIARAITQALGGARTVVNVGAGTGSYEPTDRAVVSVEPSLIMIGQRPSGHARCVRATATRLPFRDGAFDASLAILTLHHWADRLAGVRELARVARRRVVILTWDPDGSHFWLHDYFPEIAAIDRQIVPSLEDLTQMLGGGAVYPLPIPHDCCDGFLGAYWRRPDAYLDPGVRGAISAFARIDGVDSGVDRLRRDLADGTWQRAHAELLDRDALDLGYRLVVSSRE